MYKLISLGLIMLFSMTSAHADNWMFSIDCNGGPTSYAGTGDTLTIKFFNDSNTLLAQRQQVGHDLCKPPYSYLNNILSTSLSDRVNSVEISTNGTDALWIDRASLRQSNNENLSTYQWGVNSAYGWTLSKDPRDGIRWANFMSQGVNSSSCYRFIVGSQYTQKC